MGVKLGLSLREEHIMGSMRTRTLGGVPKFGLRRRGVVGRWRKSFNEERDNFCCSQNIVAIIKSRKVRWAGHTVRLGSREMHSEC